MTKGFTLIEIVVVIGLMAILGLILTTSLVQTLRGQNKIKLLNQIKQNGQVVLERISNDIRQAEEVVCVNDTRAGNSDTIVMLKQGVYTRYRFFPPSGGENGFILLDTPSSYSDTLCLDGQVNYTPISDTDRLNGISIEYVTSDASFADKIFKQSAQAGYKDAITIKFRVFPGKGAGSTYESMVGNDGIMFTTTVGVRGGR